MTVRIGHASRDERGCATGGTAGDQTGKELCIRDWYRGGWKVLLRHVDPETALKIAQSCIAACGNEKLGYDQSGRNTGLTAASAADWDLGAIDRAAEFDCSSLVTACVQAAGVAIWDGGNAPTTRTLERVLTATGDFQALTAGKYLTGTANLRAGDILLNPGSHVVIVLDSSPVAGEEKCNEIRSAVTYTVVLPLVCRGDRGELVKSIQQLLHLRGADPGEVDGAFGKNTEAAVQVLQGKAAIEIDGKVGIDTWAALLGKG